MCVTPIGVFFIVYIPHEINDVSRLSYPKGLVCPAHICSDLHRCGGISWRTHTHSG